MSWLRAIEPLLDLAAALFLLVLAFCWARYALSVLLRLRGLWLNQFGQRRRRGEQPLVEFTAGPEGNGLVWHDQVLVEVVAEFERGIGGVR
jgi:hypothetical protein